MTQYQYGIFREDIPQKAGHSKELICIANKDKPDYLAPGEIHGCKTWHEMFQRAVKKWPNNQFLGTRNKKIDGNPYEWRTYREVDEIKEHLAKGLVNLELTPKLHLDGKDWQFLGIFAKNREEWAMMDLACMRSRTTIVPFFESLG